MDGSAAVVPVVGEAGAVGAPDAQSAGLNAKAGVVWCWRKGRELKMPGTTFPGLGDEGQMGCHVTFKYGI